MTPDDRQWRLHPASECVPSDAELIAAGYDPMDDYPDIEAAEQDEADRAEGERIKAALPPSEEWCYSHGVIEQARDAVDFICSPMWVDHYRRRGLIR